MSAASSSLASCFRYRPPRIDQINLATALLRSGFMPFLALFLHERGLGVAAIGAVMAFGSIIGLIVTVPVGILVDQVRDRVHWLLGAGALALAAPVMLWQAHGIAALLCAVATMSLSEAVLAPALLVMSLHNAPRGALLEHLGRNQAFGHAGRVAGLALSGAIGGHFGFGVLILVEGLYLVLLLLLLWRAPQRLQVDAPSPAAVRMPGISLLYLGVTLGLFQIGNAALPVLLGLSLAETTRISAPVLASGSTVIAQVAMVIGSLLAIPALRRWGYGRVFAASFAILPLRCCLAAFLPAPLALFPVEILHGLGEAAQMVAIGGAAGSVDHARTGTRLGYVMLLQGLGKAASPLVAGYVAEHWTCTAAYLLLGVIGFLALSVWMLRRSHRTRFPVSGRFGLV